MPIAKVQLEDGRIAKFEVPDGTTEDQVMEFASQQDFSKQPEGSEGGGLGDIAQDAMDVGTELMSAVNRGTVNLADFLTTDQINNILQLSGSEKQMPGIKDIPFVKEATTGNFMDPGLAREAVRTGGELAGPAAGFGAATRGLAKMAPKVPGMVETGKQALLKQLASGTASQDVTGAVLSGMGSEVGGELGEAVGGETGRQVGEATGALFAPISATITKEAGKKLITPSAKKLLAKATPSIEGLKQTARGIYNDIDNLGAVVNSGRVDRLSSELGRLATKEGFDPSLHPKVAASLKRFAQIQGKDQAVSELDTLRKVTQAAASSIDPSERRLGKILIDKVDDFLDDLKPQDFKKGGGQVGHMYRDARQLWSRAKKTELLEEAFEKARNQATGFENGIRVQFRQILNNKKKLRGFNPDEINAIRKVVRGGGTENTLKMLGKFGFSEGQASNMLMGSLGVAGGAAVGGPAGAVAVPLIGQVSRGLAQKMTRNNAEAAKLISRAGKNGLNVARAYLKAIPRKERTVEELSELLMRPDISLADLTAKIGIIPKAEREMVTSAVVMAQAYRKQQEQ